MTIGLDKLLKWAWQIGFYAFETEIEHLSFKCKMTNVCLFKVSSVALGHQFKLSRLYIKTKKANHTKV